ncbi:uncharacterized protein LOC125202089 [Salvia hispanica]|uniref:uncharacterized protein LOC125202089 n=1 Tax=Salvia hispanica TaxID=49212 RepID=UPI0020090FBF|nr:uncharacterized protein LOC125202089 [Salvia hispanica]
MRSKGETFRLETNSERPWRGLKKDKLGAVIFGCKRHTIAECLKDGLFGLPAPHYAYVKNVTAGLTLYLFNYTDRKLHGIFEAVSCGEMNINPRAWITSEGTELTPYPAQVHIRERRKCRPLLEEQIKPIIAKNYYEEKHFWFELDKDQNRGLMKLFLSSPIPEKLPRLEKLPHPPDTTYSNMFDILSSSSQDDIADEENNHDTEEFSDMGEMRPNEDMHSSASENNADSSAQETKWADLFKPSISLLKNEKVRETNSASLNLPVSEMERKITSSSEQMGELPREVCQDAANTMSDSCAMERSEISFAVDDGEEVYENKMACTQYYDQDSDMLDVPFSEDKTSLDGEGELMLSVMDYVLAEEPGEACIDTKEKVRSVLASLGSYERDHGQPNLPNRASQKNNNPLPGGVQTDVSSSNFQYAIIKAYIVRLMQEVEGLKVSQLNQSLKIKHLEHELVLSKLEIDQLRSSYHKLEHKASCAPDNCSTEDCSISYSAPKESVFIVGGFDGFSWLPDLSLYSPNQDRVTPLCSMSSTRTYAAVAKLKTELYIFGGTLDGVWCDSVESYNPISNQWVQKPSLKMKKGSPAGASMHDKIFAIGGGNGGECFSEVEVFDPKFGSWIYTQSMLQKRFAPAAAAMNGAVYVAGGYDGKDYLRTVERFDPRQPAWISIGCMNERRGCHSVVAFKEKLYAIGGYNGNEMVSTMEVFDPRVGSWMMGEPMTVSRGYFGSFVLGGKMYVVGGVQDNDVLDLMECYDESSSGWQVIGATAIGKRSFCSALVL